MMFEPIEIPNKSSFKINEVCALTGIKSYVLRFWESEFPSIAPLVSSTGVKLYEYRDVEAILTIKKLLFEDKLTIEKARAQMRILMPRETLVEESFARTDSFDEGMRYDEENGPIVPMKREILAKRVLIETDFQKLLMAKAKLEEILSITEALHRKNHWS